VAASVMNLEEANDKRWRLCGKQFRSAAASFCDADSKRE
jgi:hypothetical protein